MSTDKYYVPIKELLERKGELGVNAIQRETGFPLSSLQKYLERQSYFKKTARRHWDLPERVAQSALNPAKSVTNNNAVIQSQIEGINALFDAMSAQMQATLTLMGTFTPVAVTTTIEKSETIHPKLEILNKNIKDIESIINKFYPKVSEEYQDLLKNLDVCSLIIKKGSDYVDQTFNAELSGLFLETTDTLSDDLLQSIKENQKGAN